jgi:hypothetical protein
VHIHALLLCASSQQEERDFLYSPRGEFRGEAAVLLDVAGVSMAGKTREAVHAEFQRAGFFLTHILECPLESELQSGPELSSLLVQRLPAVATRIRRSLKPKLVVLISRALDPLVQKIATLQLGCPLVLDEGRPFNLDGPHGEKSTARLREAIAASSS